MVSLIKNQLLKHLSRFTKNLKEDQINLSTFKGEGDLANLELDELVLTDLLELPSWLRLTSARCNRVNFRIQWTKLKSVPIFLTLDEVQIEVETCEDLRSMSVQDGLSSMGGGRYSFIHKVIDGMTVAVNTVLVTFRSPAFVASLQISRIMVESKSPQWQRADLRCTRIKEPEKGQLLIFKELEWQTVRIEARSTQDTNLTPLRLLTNQARCRIVIKKRMSDCFVMGSRLLLILDDLLWVLTDSQLRAALHFLNSLSGLVQKATEVTRKKKAARKLEVLPEYQAQISQQARKQGHENDLSNRFNRYDIVETSYHFLSQRIDLHLCDDPGVGRSCHPDLKDGGALQISLQHFQVDYYPYHLAIRDRKHWPKYKEAGSSHTQWLQEALASFRNSFLDLIESNRAVHTPLSRSSFQDGGNDPSKANGTPFGVQNNEFGGLPEQDNARRSSQPQSPQVNPVKNYVISQLAKLMTSCVILRIEDFTLYRVTTPKRKQMPKDFISAQHRRRSGDKDRYSFPEELKTVHAEFTYYYYPGDIPFPLPPSKFYVQLNPIQIYMDVLSVLWANSFALNLHQSLQKNVQEMNSSLPYVDVKIEAVLPRIVLESTVEHLSQRDRPKSLHVQASRVTITNVRSTRDSCSRADLAKCVHSFQLGSLFFGSDFPSKPGEFHVVNKKFIKHLEGTDNIRAPPSQITGNSVQELVDQLSRELLWVEAKDTWCVHLDPVWGEFYGTRAIGSNRPTVFFDALPITLWVYMKVPQPAARVGTQESSPKFTVNSKEASLSQGSLKSGHSFDGKEKTRPQNLNSSQSKSEPGTADIHVLVQVSNLMSIQINHYQLLFLLRLAEEAAEVATFLTLDTMRILDHKVGGSLVVGALLPQVEVTLVMPSQTPGKESSGGDVESVFPDSSSLGDELVGNHVERSGDMGSGTVDRASVHFSTSTGQVSQEAGNRRSVPHFNSNGNGRATPGSDVSSSYSMDFQTRQPTRQLEDKPVASAVSTFNNFNSVFSASKKALKLLMNTTDAAPKQSMDDASDTVSIRSDCSSGSDNFVLLGGETAVLDSSDAMFRTSCLDNNMQKVEMASEVLEEEPTGTIVTTPSERADSIDSSIKRRDLISVATFKLAKVEFMQQSAGFSSSIKVQVANVTSEECGAIPWDEFQNKFSSRSRAWVELPLDTAGHPRVQARLDHSLLPEHQTAATKLKGPWDRSCMQTWFHDLLEVRVTDLPVRLSMSTIMGLTDLVEDEVIAAPLPMEVFLENVSLHLIEDRPSNNITSPGPVPIDASVSRLHISRDRSGVFLIEPPGRARAEESAELERLQRSLTRLTTENDELRRRLMAFEQLSEENHRLRRSAEESDTLRTYLANAQDELGTLLEEKMSLLDEIQVLRQKVNRSGSSGSTNSSGKR
ncbi:UHRF1-binding protein 1-like isoform X2 [Thrips palmi]|uniref:UHRF1-binding protein 1-like isoform X2 n=1 Tax=Thrips palmi TaxID=161013 RepID=A0A6P8YRT6_THRPL|nr:UHRF1-binding protein 1-like isoform X2 [Thrips palmi]